MLILDGDATSEAVGRGVFVAVGGIGVFGGVGVTGVFVGVGVGGRTVIVTLPSSVPPKVLSCTEDEPPAQPYTVSDASSGSSQVRSRVPEHWLLLHKTWPLVITHLVDSDAGLQPPVTSTEPPTPIVVADALTQPRGSGVGVGVGVAVSVGVGVTGGRTVS